MIELDQPITNLDEDLLGRKEFINTFIKAIKNINANKSITIGLFGKWGSGKTSIINILQNELEKENNIIIFRFEPWLYSNTEQLISQFFKDFSKVINYKDYGREAQKIAQELETYSEFFNLISNIPEPTLFSLGKIFSKTFKNVGYAAKKWGDLKAKNLSQTKASLEKHLQKLNKKIIITIDDIDRLTKKEIKQIFQLVKSLANFPNTIYLLSMDREIVIQALKDIQTEKGEQYLEKIIQISLEIPLTSKSKIDNILLDKLNTILNNYKLNKNLDKDYFTNIFYIGFKDFFENIRDIKRYINTLNFNIAAIGKEVNIVDLMMITAFEVFEPKIFNFIKNNPDLFTGTFQHYLDLRDKEKEEIKNKFKESTTLLERISKETYINLMEELFIKIKEITGNIHYSSEWEKDCRKQQKLCSPDFFYMYFKLFIDKEEISKTEMDNYISTTINETQFKNTIKTLIKNNKIHIFLNRIEDYIENLNEKQIETICNVLIDLGDNIPNEKDLYISKEAKIYYLIDKILKKFSLEKKINIIKNAIDNSKNSIDLSLLIGIRIIKKTPAEIISSQSADEYKRLTKKLKEFQSQIQEILKRKINNWAKKYSFKDNKISLLTLYRWKEIDNKSLEEFIKKRLQNTDEIPYFLKLFVQIQYSQTLGEYSVKEEKIFNCKKIEDFIDINLIKNRVENLNINQYSKDIQFAIKGFLECIQKDKNEYTNKTNN